MNPTALIVPSFFVFLYLEYIVARKNGINYKGTYANSISNISIGIAERLLNLLITGSFYQLYTYLFEHYSILHIPNHWIIWILLLLTTDFVWYWYHRLGHEINVMWGAHVVHHQSEEFNYTVSARITTLQAIIRNLFWCVLPMAGFEPTMVMTVLVIHGTYSFFTHTEIIGRLGWIEKVFVTPSHHRVHHASNEVYLNKNYGDIFIFWDKLFGTFYEEQEKPVYGLTHPLKSHSFLWQHLHYYAELWEACRRKKTFAECIKILFGRPEMLDPNIRNQLEKQLFGNRPKVQPSKPFTAYLTIQIVAAALTVFFFTLFYHQCSAPLKIFVFSITLLTLINCGALLEQKRWIFYLEITRLLLIVLFVSYEAKSLILLTLTVPAIVALGASDTTEKWYWQYVLQRTK